MKTEEEMKAELKRMVEQARTIMDSNPTAYEKLRTESSRINVGIKYGFERK